MRQEPTNDPRGPVRRIVAVMRAFPSGVVTLRLSCDHERQPNPIFSYREGDDFRCFACRKESR